MNRSLPLVLALVLLGALTLPSAQGASSQTSWHDMLDQRRGWWSLQPVQPIAPPLSSRHPIDGFILARQAEHRLTLAQAAPARTLARRVSLTLTGLPPEKGDIEAFLNDFSQDPETAYASLVDRYLASPHFGEHWARHWMDVVRFSETHGYEWNHEIRDAWRFRDYLIRAFNNDLPFDQLIREHIAGDLLKTPRINQQHGFNESLIGTAFWRFGELGHDDCVSYPEIRFDALDNQIDTLSKAFQGLTVSCARCHDHKLDAISTQDYYALVGMLENCSQVVHTLDSPKNFDAPTKKIRDLKDELRQELGDVWRSTTEQLDQTILTRLKNPSSQTKKPGAFATMLANPKLSRENPAYILAQFVSDSNQAEGPTKDVATRWKTLAKEYAEEHQRREQTFAERFTPWARFQSPEQHDWTVTGLGLSDGPRRDGDYALATEGENIVASLLPAGLYTHRVSDQLNGSLRSPWLPTQKKYISVQISGNRQSMVRTVVDSCSLNEFAGGGLHYLDGGKLHWRTFPTSAGPSLRSFLELTTRSDNPRWPDRPGRAGSADPKVVNDYRSSFGIVQAVLHDTPGSPEPSLQHLLALFERPAPKDAAGIAAAFQTVASESVAAWQANQATDIQIHWLNWLLESELLPNSINTINTPSSRLNELIQTYRNTVQTMAKPRVIAGLADHGSSRGFPVLLRGDTKRPGDIVPPRYLEVISGTQAFASPGSGRRQLAELIADPQNPLTARVAVNRVWHHLFGRGIVSTPDDFGRMGERPTHPELLDYLSTEFIAAEWSLKHLVRQIVLSHTFRQTSVPQPDFAQRDPGNQWLHHYPARRLDGEAIRDSILIVSGRLNPKLFGPSIHPHRAKETDYRKLFSGPLDGSGRRSLYTKVTRMEGNAFLELFDFPNRMLTRGNRDRTNVPAQALALLNDPFVIDQAHFWATQMVASGHDTITSRIQSMFHQALGRPPNPTEEERFEVLIRSLASDGSTDDTALLKDVSVWQDAAHALFNMKELVYIL